MPEYRLLTHHQWSLEPCSLFVLLFGHVRVDPNSAEWTIAWAIKHTLRLHLGPRHRYLPSVIAKDVVAALRLSKWRLEKEPPDPPHSTFGPPRDETKR